MQRDPIELLSTRLVAEGELTESELEAMHGRIDAEVESALEAAKASPAPDIAAMFANVLEKASN
jgi:TPP-dependent pyruvate/acetoin dehydrogenase alpha subunit